MPTATAGPSALKQAIVIGASLLTAVAVFAVTWYLLDMDLTFSLLLSAIVPVVAVCFVVLSASNNQTVVLVVSLLPVAAVFALTWFYFDLALWISLLLTAIVAAVALYFVIAKASTREEPEATATDEVAEKKKAARKPLIKPTTPEPKYGFSGWFWQVLGAKLYSSRKWEWLAYRTVTDRIKSVDDEFWEEKTRNTQKTVGVFNGKGGVGKTPETGWLSAHLGRVYRGAMILAIDNNTSNGHLADLFNISSDATLSVRQTLKIFPTLNTPDDLMGKLSRHRKTGTWIIAADTNSPTLIGLSRYVRMLQHLKKLVFWLWQDTGNTLQDNANLASMYVSDTVVLACTARDKWSHIDIKNTIEVYSELGFQEKMERAIIVVLGATPSQRKKFALKFGWPLDQVYCVPECKAMMDSSDVDVEIEEFNEVDIDALPGHVHAALLEALLAIVRAEPVVTTMTVAELEAKVRKEMPDPDEMHDHLRHEEDVRPNLTKEITSAGDTNQQAVAGGTGQRKASLNGANGQQFGTISVTGTTLLDTRSQDATTDSEGSTP